MTAAQTCLRVLSDLMGPLSQAGAAMAAAPWSGSIASGSFTRLARWLEAGLDRLHEWRVAAACAGPKMALRFALSWHMDLALDALMGQRASTESQLQAEAGRITARASYIAEFAFHDEFHPERTEYGAVMDGNDYACFFMTRRAARRRRASTATRKPKRTPVLRWTRRPAGGSRRCRDAALVMLENLL